MSSPQPGWYADPDQRHQYREWDGTAWTDQVADNGTIAKDPLWSTSHSLMRRSSQTDVPPPPGPVRADVDPATLPDHLLNWEPTPVGICKIGEPPPTPYLPVPVSRHDQSVQAEVSDGPSPITCTATSATLYEFEDDGWRDLKHVESNNISVQITASRLTFACARFEEKLGRRAKWGLVADAALSLDPWALVEDLAEDRWDRHQAERGALFVGQARYSWIDEVLYGTEAGSDEQHVVRVGFTQIHDGLDVMLVIELGFPTQIEAKTAGSILLAAVASHRLREGRVGDGEERQFLTNCQAGTAAPTTGGADVPGWTIPGATPSGWSTTFRTDVPVDGFERGPWLSLVRIGPGAPGDGMFAPDAHLHRTPNGVEVTINPQDGDGDHLPVLWADGASATGRAPTGETVAFDYTREPVEVLLTDQRLIFRARPPANHLEGAPENLMGVRATVGHIPFRWIALLGAGRAEDKFRVLTKSELTVDGETYNSWVSLFTPSWQDAIRVSQELARRVAAYWLVRAALPPGHPAHEEIQPDLIDYLVSIRDTTKPVPPEGETTAWELAVHTDVGG